MSTVSTISDKSVSMKGVEIVGAISQPFKEILTSDVIALLANLHRSFEPTRQKLLKARQIRQLLFDAGSLPDFLPETSHIRQDDRWRAAKPGPGLEDRRVEITGPVDRKMVINALNTDSACFMADFEGDN